MMNLLRGRRSVGLIALAALAVLAFVLWSSQASAQPTQPPYLLYGEGEPGDIVSVYDSEGNELGTAMVSDDNTWFVEVDCDTEKAVTLSFRINGEPVESEINTLGESQAEVTLSQASDSEMMADDDAMMEDDEMMEDGESLAEGEMMEDDSEMMDESEGEMMEDDTMMADGDDAMMDDDKMGDEQMDEYPESGSGGLADEGPATGALIGTIAVLLVVAVGLGVYRLRGRRA